MSKSKTSAARFGAVLGQWRQRVNEVFRPRTLQLQDAAGVRTIRVSSRAQMMAAGAATLFVGWSAVATVGLVAGNAGLTNSQAELARMQREVAAMQADVRSVKSAAGATVERIEQRQKFLTAMLSGKADLGQLATLLPDADSAAAATGRFAGLVSPLAALEGRQLDFVRQATTAAHARYRDTETLIRRVGLTPSRLLRQSFAGMGGPYEAADAPGGLLADADPEFKALFVSWTKVDQLERSMLAVPAMKPVRNFRYTSGFGVRVDPFNGGAAMHAGIDMAGPMGEPIYATADGVVDRAGWVGGYGNLIELGHGKGIQTRYGHLSKILVKPGTQVRRGDKIALMGSTGRSTGSHLHYEVRIDGAAVSPLPFLQSSEALAAVQDRASDVAMGGPDPRAATDD